MTRFLPDRMGARLALLLAAVLVLANVVTLVLLSVERDRLDSQARAEREVERAASLVPALEAVDQNRRDDIAQQASTSSTRLRVDAAPSLDANGDGPRSRALQAALQAALPGRAIRANVRARGDGRGADDVQGVTASIALLVPGSEAESWLNLTSQQTRGRAPPRRQQDFAVALGLSLLSVLGATLFVTRQMTKPLRALAAAARAAGRGDRSARVPEQGPREVRQAATAFNDMQGRIARFEAERMRTLAAVGHDLRTPVTSLRIRAEMLSEGSKPEAAAEAEAMLVTLAAMGVMADGLVAYANGASEAETVQHTDLAVLLRRLAEERGVELGGIACLHANIRPVAVARAIGNLLDNALRYAGSATVSLRDEGQEAVIAVEDNGPGIPEGHLDDIMAPFVRGEGSRNVDTGGSGLGLAIAKAVAESHGGTLRLSIRATGGLRAELRLQLSNAEAFAKA